MLGFNDWIFPPCGRDASALAEVPRRPRRGNGCVDLRPLRPLASVCAVGLDVWGVDWDNTSKRRLEYGTIQ